MFSTYSLPSSVNLFSVKDNIIVVSKLIVRSTTSQQALMSNMELGKWTEKLSQECFGKSISNNSNIVDLHQTRLNSALGLLYYHRFASYLKFVASCSSCIWQWNGLASRYVNYFAIGPCFYKARTNSCINNFRDVLKFNCCFRHFDSVGFTSAHSLSKEFV